MIGKFNNRTNLFSIANKKIKIAGVALFLNSFFSSFFLSAAPPDKAEADGSITPIPVGANVYHVAKGDLDGDKKPELVCASYDGRIMAFSPDGKKELWTYKTGAFPYALEVRDLDGDGKSEALVASSNGNLYAIGSDGKLLWDFYSVGPMYAVTAAKTKEGMRVAAAGADLHIYLFDKDGKLICDKAPKNCPYPVANLASGDADGDGFEEIFAVRRFGEGHGWALLFKGDKLRKVWDLWKENRKNRWGAYSIHTADLDGDGCVELLLGGGKRENMSIRVLSGKDGSLLWESTPFSARAFGTTYSFSQLIAMDALPSRPGVEIVALDSCWIVLYDKDGNKLSCGYCPLVSFTGICSMPLAGGGSEAVLASTVGGDDQIYFLRFGKGWGEKLQALKRTSKMGRINENLELLKKQVKAYSGKAPEHARYTIFVSGGSPNTPQLIRGHFKVFEFCRKQFPYKSLDFVMHCGVRSKEVPEGFAVPSFESRKKDIPAKDIVALLRDTYEKENIPFFAYIGHSCVPWIDVETAKAIIKACPGTCRGFSTAENSSTGERFEKYFNKHLIPLMDMCKQYGRRVIMIEKGAWWATIPSMKAYRKLFDGTYADVLVPSVEDSNSRSPELNLTGRAGLFVGGAVNEWSARTIHDEFCWSRLWEWESPMSGHPFLRRQLTQGVLGARVFEYSTSRYNYTRKSPWVKIKAPHMKLRTDRNFSLIGSESFELITHMLGKGLLIPPKPKDMLGLSPVLIGMREPNEKYLVDAFKFHSSHQFDPDRSSAFEGIAEYWGVTPAKDYYIGKYLMGVDRHYGNFVPQTPYGFPVILPEFLEKNAFWAKDKWETDGVSMYKGDKELNALAAKKDVLADFVKESKNLPFRAEGKVFMQAQRLASGSVRITLIDSGFIDPDDRETVLHIRDASEKSELKDLLSGEKIKIENNKASLIVPAGAFRILEFKN